MELRRVLLEEIGIEDKFFCHSYARDSRKLRASIEAIGVICPVILRRSGSYFQTVDGFQRLEVVKELGERDVLAMCFDEDEITLLNALEIAFFKDGVTRGFNLIELFIFAERFRELGLSDSEIVRRYFFRLGYSISESFLSRLRFINFLEDSWKEYIARKNLGIGHLELLSRFTEEERKVVESFLILAPGANQLREILRLIDEIKRREKIALNELLSSLELEKILGKKKTSRGEKLELILERLRRMRYPEFFRLSKVFEKKLERLALPSFIKIEPADNFEEPVYRVQFDVSLNEPLLERLNKLIEISRSKEWEDLFLLEDD